MSKNAQEPSKLDPHRIGMAEHKFNVFAVTVEPGITKADVLRTDFWAHVSKQLRVSDKIILTVDDGSIYGELLVIASDRLWAKMHILQWVNLQTRDVSETQAAGPSPEDNYLIEWKGNVKKHVVIRKSDQAILHEGDQTKAEAAAWLAGHLKVTA